MEWLKDRAVMLVLLFVVAVGGYLVGYGDGEAAEAARNTEQQLNINREKKEKQDERQDKADEADRVAADRLAAAQADADAARASGDRVRRQLEEASGRAARAAAQLTGERKAAAQREAVYTELLAESTRLVEYYSAEADRVRARGEACEAAWPK